MKQTYQTLTHMVRRLQNWGGLPQPQGMIAEPIPEWLQPVMKEVDELGLYGDGKRSNHVLIKCETVIVVSAVSFKSSCSSSHHNVPDVIYACVCLTRLLTSFSEYTPGQGILPHEDGPIFAPCIVNITLGSHSVLDFYHKAVDGTRETEPFSSILLEPRSLVVIKDDMYTALHGIEERSTDVLGPMVRNVSEDRHGAELPRDIRVSLTIRHVPRVVKLKGFKFM